MAARELEREQKKVDDYFALVPIRARQNAEKAVSTRTLAKQPSDRLNHAGFFTRRLFTARAATFSYSSLLAVSCESRCRL